MSSNLKCETNVDESVLLKSGTPPIFVGSIDQGTSSTRFMIFSHLGQITASAQMKHRQLYPANKIGWHEHDPLEIWNNTLMCIRSVISVLKRKSSINFDQNPIKAVGIANQRETIIAWNAITGIPYYNAIVWDDLRTVKVASDVSNGDTDRFRSITGLPLTSYFSGMKVRWLIENILHLRLDLAHPIKCKHVRFGTMDTWLIYQLTGKPVFLSGLKNANIGGRFITDVTNASRWLFLNIHTMSWDKVLIDAICSSSGIEIPNSSLPEIMPSSYVYDKCCVGFGVKELENVPIAGILGDQQASLFGHGAFQTGQVKNTYGTGLFLMMNTGPVMVSSRSGLLTTVAYQIGKSGNVIYALEGSVSHSGSTLSWLRDKLCILKDVSDSEKMANNTTGNDGLYLVPAFSGLFAPYWRSDARACIVGITINHTYNHLVRAALEAAAYQSREVFEAICFDSNMTLSELRVDGGATNNKFLMQFQADIIGIPLVRSMINETTALGVAFAAGLAVGVWNDMSELRSLLLEGDTYLPSMLTVDRYRNWTGWQRAVRKSFHSVNDDSNTQKYNISFCTISTIMSLITALSIGYFIGKSC